MSYQKNLLTDKKFFPMFVTQFLGAFNDNVFKNAMVILITFKSFSLGNLGTEQMVALCGGIFILPFFLFSAIAGQVADKFPKNKLMVFTKLWELIVMAMGGFGFIIESIPLLLVTLFFMGLQSTFFGPVKYSILPELLKEDELIHGNSLIEMGTFLAILAGTILGGLLIGPTSSATIIIALVVIFTACLGTLASKKVLKLEANSPELKLNFNPISSTWNIVKISKEVQSVWLSILGISWFWFLGATLLSVFPIYVKDVLHANQQVVTLLLAIFSTGVATGSVACEKLSRERLELGLVPFGSIGMSIFIFDLFIVGGGNIIHSSSTLLTLGDFLSQGFAWRIVLDLFMLSVFSGLFIVPLYTLIQERSGDKFRSRVIASNNIINALFMVTASIMLTVLYSFGVSVIGLFLIMSILNTCVAIYIYGLIPEFFLRFFCVILSRVFYRVKVSGESAIPKEGPAVLVCNHVSFADWLLIAASIKRPVRFVMHHGFFKIPVIKYLFKAAKVIPIASKNDNSDTYARAFEKISSELSDGELVCIFPEGKITSNGQLNIYKKGIEKIISKNPVPVINMTLVGMWGSFFSRRHGRACSDLHTFFKRRWSKVELNILTINSPNFVTAELLEQQAREKLK